MKKKWISLLLALAVLCCLAPAASAASGYCGSNLRWSYDSDSGALVISGSGDMYDYGDLVSAPWGDYEDEISSIIIESGVTSIGAGAFANCSAATTLTMADTVTRIGSWAFHYCTALEEVELSSALTKIGNWAFNLCRSIKSVTLPQGLKTIGTGAFAYCAGLTQVQIPASVTEIGGWAFSSCTALTAVEIPQGIGEIGNGLFANCTALVTVGIPASVIVIGSSAFAGCAVQQVTYGGSSAGWEHISVGDDNEGLIDADVRCTGSPEDDPDFDPEPEPDPEPGDELTEPFDDVQDSDWFSDAVKFVYKYNIMDGVTDTTFDPLGTANRAMIVTILWRLDGAPANSGSSGFTDVPAGMWYSQAVAWATDNGVVDGYNDGTFRPTASVTREQVAAMFYRFAQHQGENVSASADLSAYPDGGAVSAYAVTPMRWAVGSGLISGTTGNRLDPQGTANRGQIAVMFMRFSSKG